MIQKVPLETDNKTILKLPRNITASFSNSSQNLNASKSYTIRMPVPSIDNLIYRENYVKIDQKIPVLSYCEITELSEGYNFIYPVTIKVVNLKEEQIFIAECSTFNLYSQAETYEGSLDGIKSLIVDDYLAFKEDYPDGLTDDAISVLRLYCAFFGQDLPY